MGWAQTYRASKVAKALQLGERVLVDGKRATFLLISDGKELYEFALYPEGAVTVDLADLDRRVKLESWEDEDPNWIKQAEDFLRWLTGTKWASRKTATVPVPPTVLQDAIRIMRGLIRELKKKGD